jgi:predicted RNA-binding protein YlqC (UPF0109 family)
MMEQTLLSQRLSQTPHQEGAPFNKPRFDINLPSGVSMLQQGSVPDGDPRLRMKDLIVGLAKALVDSPDSVVVEVLDQPTATVLRLHVAASDIGKVIGKQGRTARSIRTILSAASMKLQHRFSLDIVEVEPKATEKAVS